ncbi:hypothetical protein AXG93_1862s1250 [Marchantia polymorpha subsp. ruderalis]|nr:hypothetical protein AXG93_1862s1250 [Marchantia polymorpha subsp. ruderalis]
MGMSRPLYAIVLVCLVCSTLANFSNGEFEASKEDSRSGGRQLLQNSQLPCPENYNFFNFTPILTACPSENNISLVGTFNVKKCCQSLCTVLGANGSVINDANYDCAEQFFSYLSLAGNYSGGYFASICTDPNSPQGIYCPPVETAPPPSSAFSVGASLWSFLVALAVFEVLVLVV